MKANKSIYLILILVTIVILSYVITAQNQIQKQPVVVSAVAPLYPAVALAVNLEGDFRVDVEINKHGKVVSSKAVEGTHKLMVKVIEEAADRWQFAADDSDKRKHVRLTFTFRHTPKASSLDSTTVFYPPYKIEVRSNTEIVNTPSY